MSPSARALSWELFRHHRWGFAGIALYFILILAIRIVQPGFLSPTDGDYSAIFAATTSVPTIIAFFYLIAVFSFGFTGDLSARASMFPARRFSLPVTTAALAGWPLLYGALSAGVLWAWVRAIGYFPPDFVVPRVWPGFLLAVFLAWAQVLTWTPFGWTHARVIISVLLLTAADTIVVLALHFKTAESVMIAVLAPQLPLAFWLALSAVARARRGDVPDWRFRSIRARSLRPAASPGFRSAATAQAWFEWRQSGRSLPMLVVCVLPFDLALLFIPGNNTLPIVTVVLATALLLPRLLASFAAPTLYASNPHERDAYGLPPFSATRPITNGEMIAAKLIVAGLSTIAAWALVLVMVPIALYWSGGSAVAWDAIDRLSKFIGASRTIVLAVLILAGAVAATWKQLIQGLCIGLTGRTWLIKSWLFVMLSLLVVLVGLVEFVFASREAEIALMNALPWIPPVLAAVKMPVASWILIRLHRGGVISNRALVIGAVAWTTAVVALHAVFSWFVDTPLLPHDVFWAVAIVAVPLTRLSAAPLALAWNRHR